MSWSQWIASEAGLPRLHLSGELDLTSCKELRSALDELTRACDRVIVDLQAVNFMGSAPLGQLLALDRRLSTTGGALAVVADNANLRHIFDLTGTDLLLNIFWTTEEAEGFLRSE